MTAREIAEQMGINVRRVYRAIDKGDEQERKVIREADKKKEREIAAEIIEARRSGVKAKEIAEELGIDVRRVYRVVTRANERERDEFEDNFCEEWEATRETVMEALRARRECMR